MNKRGILLIIIIISLAIVSFYFDEQIVKSISEIRNGLLNNFFIIVTFISSEIIIFFILTALFLWKEHKRRWILPLWASLIASSIISFIIKIIVRRMRPFQLGIVQMIPQLQEASNQFWNFSFPSSHAMIAFCAIPILNKEFPKLKILWIGIASLIAFSRIYFGFHFLSDVLIGGLIGFLIGTLIVKLEKEYQFGKIVYNKIFRK